MRKIVILISLLPAKIIVRDGERYGALTAAFVLLFLFCFSDKLLVTALPPLTPAVPLG